MGAAGAPLTRALAIGAAVVLVAFLVYGFLTRFHQDWDALLRRWTAEGRGDDGDGSGPSAPRS